RTLGDVLLLEVPLLHHADHGLRELEIGPVVRGAHVPLDSIAYHRYPMCRVVTHGVTMQTPKVRLVMTKSNALVADRRLAAELSGSDKIAALLRARGWTLASYARSRDRKSTRLNSSHVKISYAVFCLKKKK